MDQFGSFFQESSRIVTWGNSGIFGAIRVVVKAPHKKQPRTVRTHYVKYTNLGNSFTKEGRMCRIIQEYVTNDTNRLYMTRILRILKNYPRTAYGNRLSILTILRFRESRMGHKITKLTLKPWLTIGTEVMLLLPLSSKSDLNCC